MRKRGIGDICCTKQTYWRESNGSDLNKGEGHNPDHSDIREEALGSESKRKANKEQGPRGGGRSSEIRWGLGGWRTANGKKGYGHHQCRAGFKKFNTEIISRGKRGGKA